MIAVANWPYRQPMMYRNKLTYLQQLVVLYRFCLFMFFQFCNKWYVLCYFALSVFVLADANSACQNHCVQTDLHGILYNIHEQNLLPEGYHSSSTQFLSADIETSAMPNIYCFQIRGMERLFLTESGFAFQSSLGYRFI